MDARSPPDSHCHAHGREPWKAVEHTREENKNHQPSKAKWQRCAQAIERGAVALVSDQEIQGAEELDVPIIIVPDAEAALHRFAIAFYNNPSTKMLTVGVTGDPHPLPSALVAQIRQPA